MPSLLEFKLKYEELELIISSLHKMFATVIKKSGYRYRNGLSIKTIKYGVDILVFICRDYLWQVASIKGKDKTEYINDFKKEIIKNIEKFLNLELT
ncbi:hypothetical protein [Cognatishimia sp.]|uniref:hypothetical protein n=1 Tax=Cognatishimia sp. TaxID=2211648 RepID=UPI003515C946|nr:hypothetical protein [Cognatishimia sp.]